MRGAAVQSRLLLIRPDHLGDVLLTLPAAAALRDALPEVRITYLVNAALAAVVPRCPAVGSIVAARPPPADRLDASEASRARRTLAERLRGKFDASVGGLAALQRRAASGWEPTAERCISLPSSATPVVGLYGPADHRVFAPWGSSIASSVSAWTAVPAGRSSARPAARTATLPVWPGSASTPCSTP